MVNYAQSYTYTATFTIIYISSSTVGSSFTRSRLAPWGTRAGIQLQPQRQHMWHRERLWWTDLWWRSARLCGQAPRSGVSRTPTPPHRSESEPLTRATPCATPNGQRTRDAPGSIWDRALREEQEYFDYFNISIVNWKAKPIKVSIIRAIKVTISLALTYSVATFRQQIKSIAKIIKFSTIQKVI